LKFSDVLVLDDVTFAWTGTTAYSFSMAEQACEITAIRGARGSGKSTLIELIDVFIQPLSGTISIGGTIVNRLNAIGASFVQGHQQGFLYASKMYCDHVKHGLVCGRYYAHQEHYRPDDVQEAEWNGCVVLNEVHNQNGNGGTYDLMPLSYSYLQRKFS
jgi:ABC-type branched-subunit amino acid transport system ATPase component